MILNTEWHSLAVDWNANTKVFNIYVDKLLHVSRNTQISDGDIPTGTVMEILESQGVNGGIKMYRLTIIILLYIDVNVLFYYLACGNNITGPFCLANVLST